MRISQASTIGTDLVGTMRAGVLAQKHLLLGQDGSPNNYDLNIGRAGEGGWRTPRHRHNFDQIRYVIKGNYPYMGDKVLPEGWVGYFPESVYYGPQDRPEGLETLVLQFGGASGNGYVSVAEREAANEALKSKGQFKDGVYTYYDEAGQRHNKDASVACFEYATGRKLEFARPRYENVVVMDPSAHAWLPQGAAGVYVKWLGSFTERSAGIGFIKVESDATYSAGMLPSITLLYQTKGRVAVEGREYGPGSAFEFLPNEGPIRVQAVEEAELVCMTLHQF